MNENRTLELNTDPLVLDSRGGGAAVDLASTTKFADFRKVKER